ncbi:hypothetical protein WME77_19360 [Sorangium sp. So ce764]
MIIGVIPDRVSQHGGLVQVVLSRKAEASSKLFGSGHVIPAARQLPKFALHRVNPATILDVIENEKYAHRDRLKCVHEPFPSPVNPKRFNLVPYPLHRFCIPIRFQESGNASLCAISFCVHQE